MNNAFLLLTPLLLLPIVALLGFVGCNQVFGLEPTKPIEPGPPPTNLMVTAGNGKVDLTWDPYTDATKYNIKRGLMSGNYSVTYTIDASNATYTDATNVVNGTTYYYVVSADVSDGPESENSNEAVAAPMNPNEDFVSSFVVGTSANTFSGWAGMEFTVSTSSLKVFAVGRVHAPGDVQKHTIKIIEKSALTDVVSVVVDTAGGTDGQMQIATFPGPVTLNMNTTYYIVSQETAGQDHVYMDDSIILTTGDATVAHAISGDGVTYFPGIPGNHCFGPLTFQYMKI